MKNRCHPGPCDRCASFRRRHLGHGGPAGRDVSGGAPPDMFSPAGTGTGPSRHGTRDSGTRRKVPAFRDIVRFVMRHAGTAYRPCDRHVPFVVDSARCSCRRTGLMFVTTIRRSSTSCARGLPGRRDSYREDLRHPSNRMGARRALGPPASWAPPSCCSSAGGDTVPRLERVAH